MTHIKRIAVLFLSLSLLLPALPVFAYAEAEEPIEPTEEASGEGGFFLNDEDNDDGEASALKCYRVFI